MSPICLIVLLDTECLHRFPDSVIIRDECISNSYQK